MLKINIQHVINAAVISNLRAPSSSEHMMLVSAYFYQVAYVKIMIIPSSCEDILDYTHYSGASSIFSLAVSLVFN